MKTFSFALIISILFSGIALADILGSYEIPPTYQTDKKNNFSVELHTIKNKQPYDLDFEIKKTIFFSHARTFEVGADDTTTSRRRF